MLPHVLVRILPLLLLQRQVAVAAGGDGTLRVLDVLRSDPLLLLEPAAGGLLATAWSPTRPLVFAAASGEHTLYQANALTDRQLVVVALHSMLC